MTEVDPNMATRAFYLRDPVPHELYFTEQSRQLPGIHSHQFLPTNIAQSEAAGGYEYDFIEKIPEKYQCMICHKVQREATITSCCCKHYCKSCIEKWFERQGKGCPHCRSKAFNHFVNRERVQDINELKLKCTNHKAGCGWEGKLEHLKTHVDSKCDYASVPCPNKCHVTTLRKQLSAHQKNDCLLRPYECKHCGHKDTYHAITGECGKFYGHCDVHKGHYLICENYPIMCPNKCQEKGIKRKDMDSHLEKCPLQPVDCPFKEVGCTTRTIRKVIQSHVENNDHDHLMLMMAAFKEMKKENAQLKQKLEEKLEKKIDSQISSLETKVSKVQLTRVTARAVPANADPFKNQGNREIRQEPFGSFLPASSQYHQLSASSQCYQLTAPGQHYSMPAPGQYYSMPAPGQYYSMNTIIPVCCFHTPPISYT